MDRPGAISLLPSEAISHFPSTDSPNVTSASGFPGIEIRALDLVSSNLTSYPTVIGIKKFISEFSLFFPFPK
jgi:hypothetical protein